METLVNIRSWSLMANYNIVNRSPSDITLWVKSKGKWSQARWLEGNLTKEEWAEIVDQINNYEDMNDA